MTIAKRHRKPSTLVGWSLRASACGRTRRVYRLEIPAYDVPPGPRGKVRRIAIALLFEDSEWSDRRRPIKSTILSRHVIDPCSKSCRNAYRTTSGEGGLLARSG